MRHESMGGTLHLLSLLYWYITWSSSTPSSIVIPSLALSGAIGSFLGTVENGSALTAGLSVTLGGINIFENDAFQLDPVKEKLLSDYLFDCQLFPTDSLEHDRNYHPHSKVVDISIVMKSAFDGKCVVIGSDLTKEYVEVNADYRS